MEIQEQELKSEWNGGTFKNLRIHNIIEGIGMCTLTLDLNRWLFFLQRFDKELRGFKNEKEKVLLEKELKELAEKINHFNITKQKDKYNNIRIPPEIIDSLNSFEDKLWDVFTRSGLETRLMDDAMKALR